MQSNTTLILLEDNLNETELDALRKAAHRMAQKTALPCTACRYCLSHCPQSLDIPSLIERYNEHCFTAEGGLPDFVASMAVAQLPKEKRPAACIGCKTAKRSAPPNLRISDAMTDFTDKPGRSHLPH